MPIVSSVVLEDRVQVDGRRSVSELHTDHLGVQYPVSYMAEAKDDVGVVLVARAAQLEADLAAAEIAANLAAVAAP